MTDRNKFEQMLEFLVNEDQAKAKEMFHQIVVEKSREIYESLLSEEFDEDVEEGQEEDDDDGMEEARAEDEDGMEEGMDEETDEGFDMSMEAGAEEDDGMPSMDGDDGMPSMDGGDDLEGDLSRDDPQEIVGDLGAAVDDLDSLVAELEDAIAAFDGGAGGGMDDEGDEEPKEQYAFEDETLVREYVEKVGEAYKGGKAAGTSESSGTNAKSIVAKKNDMGGVAAMAKGGEGGGNKTSLPGHSNAKTDNGGNVNVPGGKAGVKHLKGVPAGHGAEKKGSGDTATNKKSIIGSR